jgi:dihydrofolate reductase
LSVSLDGFVAGPNAGPGNPLGDGGERLHEWVFGLASWRAGHGLTGGESNRDSEVVAEWRAGTGAFVMGRGMFDEGEEPWGDEPPFRLPVFVVTHHARETLPKAGGTRFAFVTDGIESAIAQAKAAAGSRNVAVAGGGSVVRQTLAVGLLDELQLHLVPVFLGQGVRLFEGMDPGIRLETTNVVSASPGVTHLRFAAVE